MAKQKERSTVDYTERHGLPVLNSDRPMDEVRRLLRSRSAKLVDVRKEQLEVPRLRGFTVKPEYRIEAPKRTKNPVLRKLDGHYVSREYHGMPHPLLIVPPEEVQPK